MLTEGLNNLVAMSHKYGADPAFVLAGGLIGATPLVKTAVLKLKEKKGINLAINVIEPLFQVALLLIVTAYFVDGSFSPFLYFRF